MLEKIKNLDKINPVVVLNDFFLDRIIRIKNLENFFQQISLKSEYGGSIRGISQIDLKGGNATNVAFSLARLGCPVSLITIADQTSSQIIKQIFSQYPNSTVNIIEGNPGRTTSFEFTNNDNLVNVMVSDLGDNADFGPNKIGKKEKAIIKNASGVIVTNWASNKKGTELSKFVFLQSKSALHFLDPADIQTRPKEFEYALSKLGNLLDSLSINENECNILLKQIGMNPISKSNSTKTIIDLSKKIKIPIDLHTSKGSYWSNGQKSFFVKSFKVKPNFVTGAGDVWDAANMIGYLVDLKPKQRLMLANAASCLYVGSNDGISPTMKQVVSFLRSKCKI